MKRVGLLTLALGVAAATIGAVGAGSDFCQAAAMRAAVGGEEPTGGCYCNEDMIHWACTNTSSGDPLYPCASCTAIQKVPKCCYTSDEEAWCDTNGGGGFNCGNELLCAYHDENYVTCWGCVMQMTMCATGWKCADL